MSGRGDGEADRAARHARVHRDLVALREQMPPGVPLVIHHGAPERADGESLQAWRERVALDYLDRRAAALAYHDAGGE